MRSTKVVFLCKFDLSYLSVSFCRMTWWPSITKPVLWPTFFSELANASRRYRLPRTLAWNRFCQVKQWVPGVSWVQTHCSGSLEPESSCHDRDWIMELPMEADILTITGILTPEGASVAPCFPFDITISLSWFPLLCLHYIPLYHRGRETSSWFWGAVTLVTLKIQMYPDGYRICNLGVTIGGYRTTAR